MIIKVQVSPFCIVLEAALEVLIVAQRVGHLLFRRHHPPPKISYAAGKDLGSTCTLAAAYAPL